jgi:hypothetical protein
MRAVESLCWRPIDDPVPVHDDDLAAVWLFLRAHSSASRTSDAADITR